MLTKNEGSIWPCRIPPYIPRLFQKVWSLTHFNFDYFSGTNWMHLENWFPPITSLIHLSDQTCAAVSELYQCGAENSPLFRMILPHESLDFETVGKVILTSNRVSHQAVQKLSLELQKMKIIL